MGVCNQARVKATKINLHTSKGPIFRMTVYIDADHAHALETRISITNMNQKLILNFISINSTLFIT
jgi:hypothetical protein